jgi:prevent-host-death family protein
VWHHVATVTRIGIRELRDSLTATIRRVRAGETFEVTHDGRPVAVLAPVRASRLEELLALGDATPAEDAFTLPEPVPNLSGRSSDEIIEELRADRL